MGKLEDLIAQVEDVALRQSLAAAASEAKEARNFGLVFEQHIPETVAVLGLPLRRGQRVRLRSQIDAGPDFTVLKATKKMATLQADDGSTLDVPPGEVAVVKRFGDPIYPMLTPIGEVRRSDGPAHTVINGENYHALQTLVYLYEGQIDCIYIDPPYNTGARDWKYNNRYVDDQDSWRHSKWLSFIEKRLLLGKRLLRDDGVLIITIDEHEVHHLGMLLADVFPDALIHMVTIVHNPKGTYKRNIARVDEYAFFVCPGDAEVLQPLPGELFAQAATPAALEALAAEQAETEDLYLRRRGQESGHRSQRPNQYYAILVNEATREVVGVGPSLGPDDPWSIERDGDVVTVYPLDTRNDERVWRYSRETMIEYIERGEIVVTGHSTRSAQGWVLNHRVTRKEAKRIKSVWWEKRHDAGGHGSDLLTAYLGRAGSFPFPKSVYAVRDCLAAVVANRPNALIVDFFAGSGTTLHATCLLNLDDNGTRTSVMVTNNEVGANAARRLLKAGHAPGDPEYEAEGIFEAVTHPRSEAVIRGTRADGTPVPGEHVWAKRRPYKEGFDETVEFYKLEYLDPDSVRLGDQLDAILPMLRLAAGAVGPIPAVGADPWLIPDDALWAILLDDSRFAKFRTAIEKRIDLMHVWLVTTSEEAFARMRVQLPLDLRVSMLYRDYLRNFEINTEQP